MGFSPDLTNPQWRYDAAHSANILWFKPQPDPHCGGNTFGPVTNRYQGGAVWQQAMPTPPTRGDVSEGRFVGWPVDRGTHISQDFGCTAFRELGGYDCPSSRPWFHTGVDFAGIRGQSLYSVVSGVVTYVGVSQGVRCNYPGSEEPRTNLGWVIEIRSGPYTLKYGHTVVGSERVRAGDRITPGQVLGLMGSTGCSTGPHLHFQVQRMTANGEAFVDPLNLIGVNSGER